MKKLGLLAILLALAMLFAACGAEQPDSIRRSTGNSGGKLRDDFTHESSTALLKPQVKFPNKELALECMEQVLGAPTVDVMSPWITEDSIDRAEEVIEGYKDKDIKIRVSYINEFDGYDIFKYEIKDNKTGEVLEDSYCMLLQDEDAYRLCLNREKLSEMLEYFVCSVCNGNGRIQIGSPSTCPTCGGSGMWYNPSAYFDSFMNMWMGQYQGCHGCGGSGTIGSGSSTACTACGGDGHMLE